MSGEIQENDFVYRVKLLMDTGETFTDKDGVHPVHEFQVKPGIFKSLSKAVASLRSKVADDPMAEFGHIQIKGELTKGEWLRIVFVKKGEPTLKPCIGLRDDIWNLFKPHEEAA